MSKCLSICYRYGALRVLLFQNVRIEAEFPAEYFRVHSSTENGTYHVVETLTPGFPVIDGTLRAVLRQVTREPAGHFIARRCGSLNSVEKCILVNCILLSLALNFKDQWEKNIQKS